MSESGTSITDQIPRDGREVRVRIGRRWYAAAWAYDTDTGEEFLGVKLNGSDWVRVAHDVIEEVGAVAGGQPKRRQESAVAGGQPKRKQESAGAAARLPGGQPKGQERQAAKIQPLISIEDVARRITAMVRTVHAMPDIEARFLTAGSRVNWPATVYTWEDLRAQDENHDNRDSALKRPRHKPTPADLAHLDETWGWFGRLDPLSEKDRKYLMRGAAKGKRAHQARTGTLLLSPAQRLVWRHALGDSFAKIAKETGEHHETIRRRHGRAIERLAAIADADLTARVAARGASGGRRPVAGWATEGPAREPTEAASAERSARAGRGNAGAQKAA